MNRESQVGFLFFGVLGLLFLFTVLIGDWDLTGRYYEINAEFLEGAGLREGHPVLFTGVEVGKVKEVRFEGDNVVARLKIENAYDIPDNARFEIRNATILGGKEVSITRAPGVPAGSALPKDGSARVHEGATQDIMTQFNELAFEFRRGAQSFNQILEDVRAGRGPLGSILYSEEMTGNVQRIVREARDFMEGLNRGEGMVAALVHDPLLRDQIRGAIEKIHEVAEAADRELDSIGNQEGALGAIIHDGELRDNLRQVLSNAEELTRKANEGDGVLAALLNDPGLKTDLDGALEHLQSILAKIDDPQSEGLASAMLHDPQLTREVREGWGIRNVFRLRTYLSAEYRGFPEDDYDITKLFLTIAPNERKFYEFGASIIGIDEESPLVTDRRRAAIARNDDDPEIRLDAFIGRRWYAGQFHTRIGILEGKVGGVFTLEPAWARREGRFLEALRLRLAVRDDYDDTRIHEDYDPFLARAEMEADLRFMKSWPALRVMTIVDHLLDDEELAYGVGFTFEDKDLKYLVGMLGIGG